MDLKQQLFPATTTTYRGRGTCHLIRRQPNLRNAFAFSARAETFKFTRSYTQPLSAENFERYSVLRSLGENRHCLLDEFADAGNVKRVVVGFFAFPNFHHPDGVWIAGTFVDDIKDAAFGVFHQACSP